MTDGASSENELFDAEIERVSLRCRQLIAEYVGWGHKIVGGEVTQAMYGEVIDFVNFRLETAESCLDLIQSGKIADALGLCRSLLENYLLLMLMCRGRKLFKIEDVTSKTEGEFKTYLKQQQDKLEVQRVKGQTPACIEIRSYPRAKRHVMYIFEGLKGEERPDFIIPLHYFAFRDFQPEAMRLDDQDYFKYYSPSAESLEAAKKYKTELAGNYRHYLSYDALAYNLELNGLLDEPAQARLEAHYTFLGKFLHPTHEAARELHELSNYYDGSPAVGMRQPYTKAATLLASVYVAYCLAGLLNEIAGLHEQAPKEYIADAATGTLRSLTARVPIEFPYFWFLFNEPPLYDKFNYATYHVSEDDLGKYGGYANVPANLVPFNQHIYDNFVQALKSWCNSRCGAYQSPLLPS